ncbi:DUF3857 domain-containing transglutaminase family protein [Mucilaginibacter sp. Bleaf8]|uniref:DUF3857 domain-containing protein n=1 Tax=Mucilaginibacter sp. Bleaf8 TaxID=2834430 RepID=UPI001BCEF5ED|nr:DUF3857 domain-containing transglutaminase family protein [Mucilaginibacter sp. Bleaf8]MBS7565269.1 DUF3857 domain-containing transglutaminase family protein [Mucilaginibacter sp. Bleaf8]
MKLILSLLLLAALITPAAAQNNYEIAAIPKDLLPYASAVVRKMDERTEVKSLDNTVYHLKVAITILNDNGDDHAEIVVPYDKSNRIRYIKGVVYDEFGKPVTKFTDRNFSDESYADGFSLFTDNRLKHFRATSISYPFTIEYEVETTSKQSLNLGNWHPNPYTGTAVQSSTCQFVCKPDFNLHYKELNYPGKVAISTDASGMKVYTWSVSNLKAIRSEPYSPDYERYKTLVKFAPEKFYYEGYNGSYTNWNELGKWQYENLLRSRMALPTETEAYIKRLTDTIKTPKDKAKAIYEYMQHKTRYISVQVGIGGFQPFLAADVDRLSYGDCKALVNYTQALLKVANIESYYCIVQAGSHKKSLLTDFASMEQGNHIILCLPFKSDTTWLECTSQRIPFGFLGDFTDDRWVLACTPSGGKLMHTPRYTAEQNRQVCIANLTLKETGEIDGSMNTTFEGTQYENRNDDDRDDTERVKKLKEIYAINNLEIETLNYKRDKKTEPVNQENIRLNARDYASLSSGKYFVTVNLANRMRRPPREVRNRTTDVYINRGYTDIDEITYNVPAGLKMESRPLLVSITKPFGKFTATAVLNEKNQLVYKRKLQMIDGHYPKESYQELVDFFQAVVDADDYSAILAKAN